MKRTAALAMVGAALLGACTESSDDAPTATGSDTAETTAAPTGTADAEDTGGTTPDDTADEAADEAPDEAPDDTASGTDATTAPSDGSVVSMFAGQDWFAGTIPDRATAADDSAEPIRITMINQENSPAGSFPELRSAAQAAVAFVNAELGGVNGRPIRLEPCITDFSVERSQACAQEAARSGAVVVTSGIDVGANASLPVLEQNGLPLVGGVPATLAEMRSGIATFFSGGVTGAYMAFAEHAAREGRTKIAFAYGEFESFEVPVKEYGVPVAESLGLETELIPFPLIGADMLPVLTAAVDTGADAIVVGAADTACVPTMTTLPQLDFEGQLYLTGACAAPEILAQVPDDIQAQVIFNSEGGADQDAESSLFDAAIERYAAEPAGGAGTVTFRSTMNLWNLLTSLDTVDAASVAEALATSVDVPSFWGHPYTCAEEQVTGMPSLCAPQQQLLRFLDDGGDPPEDASGGWIDVSTLLPS